MTFKLREVDKSRIYRSIAGQLHEAVRTGTFLPGQALPPERKLAEQFGVSRSSVREAVRVLEHAGVLDVRTGSGTYVTSDAMSKSMFLRIEAVASGQYSPLDILIVRRALEPVSARLAATERTSHDLKRLTAAFKEHTAHLKAGEDPTEPDRRFHVLVGAASHNPVLETQIEAVIGATNQKMWRELKGVSLSEHDRAKTYLDGHAAILAAIKGGDSVAAVDAMNGHLDDVEAGLLSHME